MWLCACGLAQRAQRVTAAARSWGYCGQPRPHTAMSQLDVAPALLSLHLQPLQLIQLIRRILTL